MLSLSAITDFTGRRFLAGAFGIFALVVVSVLAGITVGNSQWMIALVPIVLAAVAVAARYPLPAIFTYLYVLALTPDYVGIDVRTLLPLNASRAVGLIVFSGLALHILFRLAERREGAGHPIIKFLLPMWLVVTVVPGLVDAGSLTALLRGSLISTLDFIAPCFFVAYFIRDQKSRDRIVRHLLIAGSIVALFGLFEFATATNFFVNLQPQLSHSEIWTVIYQRGGLARVTANFGQPISFGRYFAFLLPIAIIYCTNAQGASSQAHRGSARGRSLYAVATILCVLGVLISLSGGPFWGALVAMAVLVALKPKSTLRLSIAGAGLFALPALFFLSLNSIQSVLLAFLGQNTAVSSSISANAGVRLAVLQFVERVLPRSPLFGFGSFERIPYMPTILPNGDIVNTYAVYLLLYGIVGLLAFLIIISWAVWTAARNIFGRPESPQRVFAIALFASLMGQLGIMIGVSPVGPGAQFFWVLIGLIGSLCWTPEPQAVVSERVVAGVVAERPAHA